MSQPYNTLGHIKFDDGSCVELSHVRQVFDRIFDMILNDKLKQFKSSQMMLKPWADITLNEVVAIETAHQLARDAAIRTINDCSSNQLQLEPSKPTSFQYDFFNTLGQSLTKVFKLSQTAPTPPPFALSFTQ
jgi:hypothetical protein